MNGAKKWLSPVRGNRGVLTVVCFSFAVRSALCFYGERLNMVAPAMLTVELFSHENQNTTIEEKNRLIHPDETVLVIRRLLSLSCLFSVPSLFRSAYF